MDLRSLQFLARLKSLRHLRIEAFDFKAPTALDGNDKPKLPQLNTLELIGNGINDLDKLLDYVVLPRIEMITLEFSLFLEEREILYDLDSKLAEDLYWRIFRFKETLQHVYLCISGGMYQVSLDHIKTGSFYGYKSEPPYAFHTNWQPGNPERVASYYSVRSGRRKIRDDEILDGIVAGVNELKLWVGEEIDGAQRLGDIPKAKHLWNVMKPIWELREWSRD